MTRVSFACPILYIFLLENKLLSILYECDAALLLSVNVNSSHYVVEGSTGPKHELRLTWLKRTLRKSTIRIFSAGDTSLARYNVMTDNR